MMVSLGYLFEILLVILVSDSELSLPTPLDTPTPHIELMPSAPTPLEIPT